MKTAYPNPFIGNLQVYQNDLFPGEVLRTIWTFLDFPDDKTLINCRAVCKFWFNEMEINVFNNNRVLSRIKQIGESINEIKISFHEINLAKIDIDNLDNKIQNVFYLTITFSCFTVALTPPGLSFLTYIKDCAVSAADAIKLSHENYLKSLEEAKRNKILEVLKEHPNWTELDVIEHLKLMDTLNAMEREITFLKNEIKDRVRNYW